jgi:DNA gyrase subunit A
MNIIDVSLEEELQTSYIDYAMSVIIGRAIPDVRDGLKPVQRRILYAMYNIKNLHNLPTKKSARIVGEVIGKFHPHGDQAVYSSLVRMAQDFSMNHLLVEGQGNFGSVDGDPPAAMRYTEVRLTRLAGEMLSDLEKETVEFVPNFDNTEQEPVILPSKIPALLINGTSGIAVGVATSIPSHNINEVCDAIVYRLANEEAIAEDILKIIKGPDFPTGGIAIMSQSSYDGYKNGRGQLTIRAKAKVEDNRIVIGDIPYNVNKSNLIRTIVDLVKEKKVLGIKDIRDESDKAGVRLVIELKGDFGGEQTLNRLYKHTQLEVTFPIINLVILGKQLRTMSILQLIDSFIDHRKEMILKRSRFDLNVSKERLHIVEGLLIAIDNIDKIVKEIKESSEIAEARAKLSATYSLSEKQANAILDMKLSRLTHLEETSLLKEKAEHENKITYFTELINNKSKIIEIIRSEAEEIKKNYGRERRTEIIESDQASEFTDEDLITNEKVSIILTNGGYIKRMAIANYRDQSRGGKGIISINLKEGDYVKQIQTCNNKDFLLCISDAGKAYWLKAYAIPESSRYSEGKAIANMLNIGEEKIVVMFNTTNFEGSKIAFLTKKGIIKRAESALFSRPRTTGVRAINLNESDAIADAIIYTNEKYLILSTKKGKSIKFAEDSIRFTGRTSMGVRGIRLSNGDTACNIIAAGEEGSILTVTENGYGKLTDVEKYRIQGRGGSGVINLKVSEKTGTVAKSLFVKDEKTAILINSLGISISFPIASIRVTGRAASGVRLMRLEQGSRVVDAQILAEEEKEAT